MLAGRVDQDRTEQIENRATGKAVFGFGTGIDGEDDLTHQMEAFSGPIGCSLGQNVAGARDQRLFAGKDRIRRRAERGGQTHVIGQTMLDGGDFFRSVIKWQCGALCQGPDHRKIGNGGRGKAPAQKRIAMVLKGFDIAGNRRIAQLRKKTAERGFQRGGLQGGQLRQGLILDLWRQGHSLSHKMLKALNDLNMHRIADSGGFNGIGHEDAC